LAKGEVALEGDASELLDRPELLAAYLGDEAAESPTAVGA
jgi:ABC-type branched-subunit amino acid transport system ATPase component